MVISMDAAHVDNAMHLDYLTSQVALEEPEIGSTDPNIPIDNNCTDDKLYLGMAGGSKEYEDERDQSDECTAILCASLGWWASTELNRFHLGTRDVDGYEAEDGYDVDAD